MAMCIFLLLAFLVAWSFLKLSTTKVCFSAKMCHGEAGTDLGTAEFGLGVARTGLWQAASASMEGSGIRTLDTVLQTSGPKAEQGRQYNEELRS